MGNLILGLDVSTTCIGISLFEDEGDNGKLVLLHHVTPNIKAKQYSKTEEIFIKANIFKDEFLIKYKDVGIKKVIIEEPLLGSNNVNTVAILLRFNGIISKICYDILGIVPDFISSYDARKYGFPELMAKRTHDKKGNEYTPAQLAKNKPVLFGAYKSDVDKKEVIWNKVADREPQIVWSYDKKNRLSKSTFDTSDSYVCVLGYMRKENIWK